MRVGQGRQVTVITGASSGVGRATAPALAHRGGIIVVAARHGATLAAVADECARLGGRAVAVGADLSREEDGARTLLDDLATGGWRTARSVRALPGILPGALLAAAPVMAVPAARRHRRGQQPV
jgi:NAD(P)-dependent dehydrogenase (short-subunit alcohol dehydrogenase family)